MIVVIFPLPAYNNSDISLFDIIRNDAGNLMMSTGSLGGDLSAVTGINSRVNRKIKIIERDSFSMHQVSDGNFTEERE
jgi:hypothetical protein